jgi:hypothetical protein
MNVLKTKLPSDRLLPRKMVQVRYGRGPKTLTRWTADPEIGFPASVDICGCKFYREIELVAFDRRLAATSSKSRKAVFSGSPSYAEQPEPV